MLKPIQGALAGLAGALLMLVIVFALQPIFEVSASDALMTIGSVMSRTSEPSNSLALTGLVLHLALGTLFGLLYALSQQSIPPSGLFVVGGFYGFILGLVGSLVVGLFFGEAVRIVVRSLPWISACVAFGLLIASVGLWSNRRQRVSIAPRD